MTKLDQPSGDQPSDRGSNDRPRAPRPQGVDVGASNITTRVKNGVEIAGDMAVFTGQSVKDFPNTFRRYFPEVFHQTGILILGSALIIWLMMFIMGMECGLEASATLKQIGAPLYSGVFDAYCALRECSAYMFGWIFAAKVGCGYVAELGSMRIADEIDAMEVMGVHSKSYLVGTRFAAMLIAVPLLWFVGLAAVYLGAYLLTVVNLGTVSTGGFLYIFWQYQSPYDTFATLAKVVAEAIAIAGVGLYYGYTASGGPVGVGRATAKSMVLNLILVSLIGMIGTMVFWGVAPNAPIAN